MTSRRIEHITKDAINGTDHKESNVDYTKADHKLRSGVEQNIKDMTAKGHIPELPHEWPEFPTQDIERIKLRKS
jgi:hypothetical protein